MNEVQNLPFATQVRLMTGPQAGRLFEIKRPATTLGRGTDCDIVLYDPTISRLHARIFWSTDGHWLIEKLAQQNSLTVSQQTTERITLQDHDLIGLGSETTLLFLLRTPAQAEEAPMQAPRMATIEVALPRQEQVGRQGTHIAPPLNSQDTPGVPLLEISTNTRQEKYAYQLDRPTISIGRDPANEIVINEQTISGFHAQIVREGPQLVLIHPHPTRQRTVNGLFYQGQKIAGDQPFRQRLKRGDVFRIGDAHGTLVTLAYHDGSAVEQVATPEIAPLPLDRAVLMLGRLPDNHIVLDHPQVSAHHARLERSQGTYRITDLHSTNHLSINARQVKEGLLQAGDEVRIGPFRFMYTGTHLIQRDEASSVRIDALQLRRYGHKDMLLLNDISLSILPRTFVALVGASGAGKSTLLGALSGLLQAQQGTILYNGQDYYQNLAAFRAQMGYVPQDDIVHRDLSVERALYYAARLRLPDDFTAAQIRQRIDEVLEEVEMKHRRTLLVSKLSGGQRKRVSIALELLANPSVFFLDEPTSGLDPGLDRKMMFLLRRLADQGHTIVLVTHATSNINVCDTVCFLAQGGRLVYFGPPNEAKAFFDKSSFAEIYSAVEPTEEQPDAPTQAEARFLSSPDYHQYVKRHLPRALPEGASAQTPRNSRSPYRERKRLLRQFWLLSLRYLELLKNDRGNLLLLLLQAPVIGLILIFLASPTTFAPSRIAICPTRANILATSGPIVSTDCQRVLDFLSTPQGQAQLAQQGETAQQALQDAITFGSGGDAQEILFIMSFAAVMFGCINAAREIVKEKPIYRRERIVNLGILPYLFSKCLVLGMLCLAQSGVLVLMVNVKAPFSQGIFLPPLLEFYITLSLTSLAGLMLGLTISALVPNTDRAMSFVPIVLIPQVIFSGVIFSLDGTVTQGIGALFATRWAMAGLGSSLGLHGDKLGVDGFSYCGTLFSTCSRAQAIEHLLLVWAVLIAMILALGGFVAYCLKRSDS